ncbi:hypothetical protein D3C78_1036830 [compost metagenome]
MLRQLGNTALQQIPHLRTVRSYRQAHFGAIGNDIARRTRMDGAHGDNGCVERMDVTRHHALQRHHYRSTDHHRIDCLVRHRTMATQGANANGDLVGRSHVGTGQKAEFAHWIARHIVQREHRVTWKQFKQTVFEHFMRAGATFLGRLENHVQRALERFVLGQVFRRSQQRSGMTVVATSMHFAFELARIGQAGGLLDGQRVHIGPQAQGATLAIVKGADHSGTTQSAMHGIAPLLQAIGDQVTGHELLETEFRMRMNAVTQLNHLVLNIADTG